MDCSGEALYLLRDNASHFVMLSNDEPIISLSYITRALIEIDGVIYDSDVYPGLIWWTDQIDYDGQGTMVDVLKFQLGSVLTQPAGRYDDCRLTLFDVSNPNGVVFTSALTVFVR